MQSLKFITKMDAIIEYNEAAGFLKNPPSLEPNFANICALQNHDVKALSQLFCPQSAVHGWLGLTMDPATYNLLEGVAFAIPNDPRPTPVYPQWAAPTTIKMINVTFVWDKNYFLSFKNIAQACFRMFDENVGAQFKVSNNPTLTGWNLMMTVFKILNQLQDLCGKPNMMMLCNNNTLFRCSMTPGNSPKMLFYQIEQCQEIQCIGKIPYSNNQIIATAVRILVQSNIFPLKEFNMWEAMATKTYPALKMFIHKAYGWCLTAIELHNICQGRMVTASNRIYTTFWMAPTILTIIRQQQSPKQPQQRQTQPVPSIWLIRCKPTRQTSSPPRLPWQSTNCWRIRPP
jgi:hypothetical protein